MSNIKTESIKDSKKRNEHPYWIWESIQMIPDVLRECFDKELQDRIGHISEQFMKRGINKSS
jgi:hypothetical protein